MNVPHNSADWHSPVNKERALHKSARIWRRPLGSPITKQNQNPKRLLSVTKGEFSATVTFEKQDGIWIAKSVPISLTYLRGVRAQDFRLEIEADGWTWQWENSL